jgi:small multidrug resistance pump
VGHTIAGFWQVALGNIPRPRPATAADRTGQGAGPADLFQTHQIHAGVVSRPMTYLYLAVAILAEVAATTFMKLSDGFTRPVPSVLAVLGYGVAFFFLSIALKSIHTGIAYAIWSGVGIVLITLIAWMFQGQKLDAPAIAGMGLIVAGVLVMNLMSNHAS